MHFESDYYLFHEFLFLFYFSLVDKWKYVLKCNKVIFITGLNVDGPQVQCFDDNFSLSFENLWEGSCMCPVAVLHEDCPFCHLTSKAKHNWRHVCRLTQTESIFKISLINTCIVPLYCSWFVVLSQPFILFNQRPRQRRFWFQLCREVLWGLVV